MLHIHFPPITRWEPPVDTPEQHSWIGSKRERERVNGKRGTFFDHEIHPHPPIALLLRFSMTK